MKEQFKIDVWDCTVTLVTTFYEFENEFDDPDEAQGVDQLCCMDHGRDQTIFVDLQYFIEQDDKTVDYCELWRGLSHECNHAAMCILTNCGVIFDGDNQEPLAYTQDLIFAKCYSFLFAKIKEVEDVVSTQTNSSDNG